MAELLAHYEGQSDDDAIVEDAAMLENDEVTTMGVPKSRVPEVRRLIAEHAKAEG